MLTLLAFLFALAILAKMYCFFFQPKYLLRTMEWTIQKVQDHFVVVQMITLVVIFVIGGLMTYLLDAVSLIATGWFWSSVYFLGYLPLYTCKDIQPFLKKLIVGKEALQRMQLIFGFFLTLALVTLFLCLQVVVG